MSVTEIESRSKTILYEDLNVEGLNPDRVLDTLNVTDQGQPKPTKKSLRHITDQFKGLKKPARIRLLFSLYPNDPFWKSILNR